MFTLTMIFPIKLPPCLPSAATKNTSPYPLQISHPPQPSNTVHQFRKYLRMFVPLTCPSINRASTVIFAYLSIPARTIQIRCYFRLVSYLNVWPAVTDNQQITIRYPRLFDLINGKDGVLGWEKSIRADYCRH